MIPLLSMRTQQAYLFGLLISLLGGLFTPFTTHALSNLVPCGNNVTVTEDANQICYTGECNACDVQKLALNVLNFLVTFSVIIAALLFVNAGVLYITSPSNPGNIGRAHKLFTNTLVGLIIILAAYLLVDTIMKALYEQGGANPWSTFLCKDTTSGPRCIPKQGGAIGTTAPPAVPKFDPVTGTPSDPGPYNTSKINITEARKQLKADGIPVYGSYGPPVQQGVIDQLKVLNQECGGCVVVTSLTGGTHSEGSKHYQGLKADIDDTPATNAYIQNNWTLGAPRGGAYSGQTYIDPNSGTVCVKESTHYDCCFNRTDGRCT